MLSNFELLPQLILETHHVMKKPSCSSPAKLIKDLSLEGSSKLIKESALVVLLPLLHFSPLVHLGFPNCEDLVLEIQPSNSP